MNLIKLLFLSSVLPVLIPVYAPAQVIINEVCTYNGAVLEDEDGDEPDWIELYNSGSLAVDLYHFSLDRGDVEPWYFPQVTLQPEAFLVVFTSGKNRVSPIL